MVWSLSMTYLGMSLGASFKSNLVILEKEGPTYYLSPILLVWLIGLGDYRGIIVKWQGDEFKHYLLVFWDRGCVLMETCSSCEVW